MKALLPLGLLAVAVLALFRRTPDEWDYEVAAEAETAPPVQASPRQTGRRPAKRLALAGAFTTLFFAGAAFTAGAGDQAVRLMEDDATALEAEQNLKLPVDDAAPAADPAVAAPAPEAAVPEAAPAEPAAAPAPAEQPVVEAPPEAAVGEPAEAVPAAAPAAAPTPATEAALAAEPADEPAAAAPAADPAPSSVRQRTAQAAKPDAAPVAKPAPVRAPARKAPAPRVVAPTVAPTPAPEPEIEHEHGDNPTVWLNRALPDPTPASARLARSFATSLRTTSKRHGADWAVVLGVLRAQGNRGAAPASPAELNALAEQVAGKDAWKAALALSGRTGFADQADALADLYRSVGLQALVTGYAEAKDRLSKRLLEQEGVLVYDGGRQDIEDGRIDVRVIVLLGYLAQRHESITVSSLYSGHRMFSRPGVVSAHIYGHAVDVASVGGTPIFGNSRPGGLTEEAVRSILLLPSELQPRQVISLLGLGGPSFPMRDHEDHIHVGF